MGLFYGLVLAVQNSIYKRRIFEFSDKHLSFALKLILDHIEMIGCMNTNGFGNIKILDSQ